MTAEEEWIEYLNELRLREVEYCAGRLKGANRVIDELIRLLKERQNDNQRTSNGKRIHDSDHPKHGRDGY